MTIPRIPGFMMLALLAACRRDQATHTPRTDPQLVLPQPFPDAARVEALAQQPVAPLDPPARRIFVEQWSLHGPGPTRTAAIVADDADATALASLAAPGQRVTTAMGCYARELAAFVQQHDAQPSDDLSSWIGGRCGVGHVMPQVLFHRVGPRTASRLDPAKDGEALAPALARLGEAVDLGIGRFDDGKDARLVIAGAPRRVTLDDIAMTAEDGRVTITGESDAPIGWAIGYATDGEIGVSTCTPTAARRQGPRAFALSCAVNPKDAQARIEVTIAAQNRLMGTTVADVWVSPDGSMPTAWTAQRFAVPAGEGERDASAWLTAINAVRQRAKLPAWTHARAQSDRVAALLPHLLAGGGQSASYDEVALAMLAGWDVEGVIRDGRLALSAVPLEVPLDRKVSAALSSPTFRSQVVSSEIATAAIAVHDMPAAGVSRLGIVGYSLFVDRDYTQAEQQFLDTLDADRGSRGLPPVVRAGGPRDRARMAEAAARVRKGESVPSEELQGLLDHFSTATGQTMRGAIFSTLRLDGFRPAFDGPLALAPQVIVLVGIADWRPPGAAWGQHVIYVVFAVPGDHGGGAAAQRL
ncbi:MAG: hypothetical protein K1X88_18650 [Nannocystaceae bacterium]|nr:hypothetical protein [Nannocystaceae bacterium]